MDDMKLTPDELADLVIAAYRETGLRVGHGELFHDEGEACAIGVCYYQTNKRRCMDDQEKGYAWFARHFGVSREWLREFWNGFDDNSESGIGDHKDGHRYGHHVRERVMRELVQEATTC
jgi:hypothetical protein